MPSQNPDDHVGVVLDKLRANSGAWIASADAKATTLLALETGLLALSTFTDVVDNQQIFLWARGITVVLLVLSMAAAVWVLSPILDRKKLLAKHGCEKPVSAAWSYFGDASPIGYDDLVQAIKVDSNLESFRAQEREQAFVLALIATKKMERFWLATRFFAASFGMSLALIVFVAAN